MMELPEHLQPNIDDLIKIIGTQTVRIYMLQNYVAEQSRDVPEKFEADPHDFHRKSA